MADASDTSQMANASDTSKTSFAEKDGNESTESTQIPLKDRKSFEKKNTSKIKVLSPTKQSKTSFAEKDGNESTESTQVPLKNMKSFEKKNNSTTSQMADASDTSQMANASDTSKTSFAEKDGNESTESTQIPLKDRKSFEKKNTSKIKVLSPTKQSSLGYTSSQMADASDTSQMADASDTSQMANASDLFC